MRTALLIGATGLTGGHCLEALLEDDRYEKVTILVRRTLPLKHQKLEQQVVDFDDLDACAETIQATDLFCCLGTTIKKAGSKEAFCKVDLEYPRELARIASANGVENFAIISAMEASEKSALFYGRIKGQMEQAVAEYPFKGVYLFRPSLLMGEREKFRLAEGVGIKLLTAMPFLLVGSLKKLRPIKAEAVAAAMITAANSDSSGTHVYTSDQIQEIYDTGRV